MDSKMPYFELLYQYNLKKIEAEIYIEGLEEYLNVMTMPNDTIPSFVRETSIQNSNSLLSFYKKRKSILEYNIKNMKNELEKI